jgi:hypothetical protein
MNERRHRYTNLSSNFWQDPDFQTMAEKYIWLYLTSHPMLDMIGMVSWSIIHARQDTKLPRGQIQRAIASLADRKKIYIIDEGDIIWIPAVIKWTLYGGKCSENQLKGVVKLFKKWKFVVKDPEAFENIFTQVVAGRYDLQIF